MTHHLNLQSERSFMNAAAFTPSAWRPSLLLYVYVRTVGYVERDAVGSSGAIRDSSIVNVRSVWHASFVPAFAESCPAECRRCDRPLYIYICFCIILQTPHILMAHKLGDVCRGTSRVQGSLWSYLLSGWFSFHLLRRSGNHFLAGSRVCSFLRDHS